MLAQLSPYRNCAVLPLKEEGQSHSTMLWTHFARWTTMRRKPAVVTTASCASAGFSAAAAARAAIANLSNNEERTCGAVRSLIGWKGGFREDAMTGSELRRSMRPIGAALRS